MADGLRDILIGDVTNEIFSHYKRPIVCGKSSPEMEGFVPTSFGELSSVVGSVGLILGLVEDINTVVLCPVNTFRSKWKYYSPHYALDLSSDFDEMLLGPCILVSKLNEHIPVKSIVIHSNPVPGNIIDSIREQFIFEYFGSNLPDAFLKKAKF